MLNLVGAFLSVEVAKTISGGSTTHVCSGGIIGSGLGRKLAEVRWASPAGWCRPGR